MRRRTTSSDKELVERVLEGSRKGREIVRKAFQHAGKSKKSI